MKYISKSTIAAVVAFGVIAISLALPMIEDDDGSYELVQLVPIPVTRVRRSALSPYPEEDESEFRRLRRGPPPPRARPYYPPSAGSPPPPGPPSKVVMVEAPRDRYPGLGFNPRPDAEPLETSASSIKEPITAASGHGHGHHDYVDYGAYTGGWGAFGWYSDHPVNSKH